MNIRSKKNGGQLTVILEGRLDTLTSPELEDYLDGALDGVTKLIFDFADLKYVSSAGLRVLLTAERVMEDQGEMTVRNVCPEIMDVFGITGFDDILNIE